MLVLWIVLCLTNARGKGLVGKKRIFVDSCSALSVESAHGLTWEEKGMSGGG